MKSTDMLKNALDLVSGPLGQFWKNIYGKDGDVWFVQFKKYLRGEATWLLTPKEQLELFQFVGSAIIPASPGIFNPERKFKHDSLEVKFSGIDVNLRSMIGTSTHPEPRRPINYFDLRGGIKISLLTNLASVRPSSLQDVWHFLLQQPNGEDGALTISHKNIFFIDLHHQVIPVIFFYYSSLTGQSMKGWQMIRMIYEDREEKELSGCRIFLR